jgi:predicted amino acid racemase
MQHNSNIHHQDIPEVSLDNLDHALATLKEHFDDVVVAVHHQDTRNIKVTSSNPYAGLGMLPTIQTKLRGAIEHAEMTQLIHEESYEIEEDDRL